MMKPGSIRLLSAILGLALLASCVFLQRAPRGLADIDKPPSAIGGCAPHSSPYLKQSSAVLASAISYCAGGDAHTGVVSLTIPKGGLKGNDLVVAGYLGSAVTLRVHRPSGRQSIVLAGTPREIWTDMTWQIPEEWRNETLQLELLDAGTGHAEWAGMGLRRHRHGTSGTAIILLLCTFLFGIALLMPTSEPTQPSRPAVPGVWRKRLADKRIATCVMAIIVLCAGASFYKGPPPDAAITPPAHPDQIIPVKVLQSMHSHHDMNTDWARADLPAHFLKFRYNFSGYLIFSRFAIEGISSDAIRDTGRLANALQQVSRWCSALTLAVCFVLLACQLNHGYALVGTLAVALVPQLFQDAHYARPEALATLLFTTCFALSTIRPRQLWAQCLTLAATAAFAGFLTSIKFTFAIASLLPLTAALSMLGQPGAHSPRWARFMLPGSIVVSAFLTGFAVGAPHALLDTSGYLQGIDALRRQYGGGHPPHMSIDGGFAGQAGLICAYYAGVLGLPAILLHLFGYSGKRMAPSKFAYAAILVATLTGFLLQKVFFERNFSPLIPVFIIIMTAGVASATERLVARPRNGDIANVLAAIMGSLLFVSTLYRSLPLTVRLSPHFNETGLIERREHRMARQQAAATRIGASRIESIPFAQVFRMQYPKASAECALILVDVYGDDWSARYLRDMPGSISVLEITPSDFQSLPVSTLQVYHDPTTYLLRDSRSCTFKHNANEVPDDANHPS